MPLLEIKNLKLDFGSGNASVRAVDDLSLRIEPGETVCLVGESGCGKSVTALSIARLLPSPPVRYTGGEILLNGQDVLKMSKAELREIRGGVVSYVFQEPAASLNPVMRVGNQIKEVLKLHRPDELGGTIPAPNSHEATPKPSRAGGGGPSEVLLVARRKPGLSGRRLSSGSSDEEVIRLLKLVGIPAPESRLKSYPHEMSGGMQQRIMIAMALASRPKLLIADEPTTALDVTIQAQIIELLRDLKQQFGMAILLITHNLGIVGDLADRVAVMYAGQIVETAPAAELLHRPRHPYTQALMDSVPKPGSVARRLKSIPGSVPQLNALPSGCRFHPRCPKVQPDCSRKIPALMEVESNRWVRCPFWSQAV
jgi:oligopeptide/dipeptide ABC transporter ATP-binding protein